MADGAPPEERSSVEEPTPNTIALPDTTTPHVMEITASSESQMASEDQSTAEDVSGPADSPSGTTPSQSTPPPAPPIQVSSPSMSRGRGTDSPEPSAARMRTDSQSTANTQDASRSSARNSLVFVVSALETILASKDAAKRKELRELTERALGQIRAKGDPRQIDPKILFEPLRLATEATTETVITSALDCIGKLISYSYFSLPSEGSSEDQGSLIDQAIDTICDCFEGEATPDRIQLQIMISLLAAVLNDKVVVHGSGLLKAVRQMYNIFLHSKNTRNQQVAQGTLTQMVGTVFERARIRIAAKEVRSNLVKTARKTSSSSLEREEAPSGTETPADINGDAVAAESVPDVPVEKDGDNKMTLQTFERRGSFDEDQMREGPTMVTRMKGRNASSLQPPSTEDAVDTPEFSEEDDEDEVFMKDAFLVFRAMCKISIKPLRAEEIADMRSQGMRTKLLSLHIIHMVLFNNVQLFLSPLATIRSSTSNEATPFIQATKQVLCQSLSRNAASSVNRVFEVSCEIFWMMLKHLRVLLKKEVEVFLKEIYYNILESRNAPVFQKQCFLSVLERLSADSRALVEIYLNYDCDRSAADNMFQRFIEHLSRMSSASVSVTSVQQHAYQQSQSKKPGLADWQTRGTVPPSLSTVAVGSRDESDPNFPAEYAMKQHSLECLVETLRSLIHWAQQGVVVNPAQADSDSKVSSEDVRDSTDFRSSSQFQMGVETPIIGTPIAEDDPMEVERAKQRKTALTNAIRQFNFKPKRGLKALIDAGAIRSSKPEDVARFLLTNNEQLNKAALGEFLGEGDDFHVAILHSFVDMMDFTRTRFVDALRRFLQSFRLPGEAQKIDRFMLKFAERYMSGNPNAFANADTAYVLAFSVIMLNTDQHSVNIKDKRMTPEDFIKNNRGINDNADLPEEYLRGIFDEIAHNEIVLDTERETAANMGYAPPAGGLGNGIGAAFANVGRDLQREAYMQRSEEMANKTEQLFRTLIRAQRRGSASKMPTKFIPATSFKHVGPMFDVTWAPFLTALSGCAQDTNNLETVKLCMDGLRLAVQLACMFDLEDPRQAFVASIARFTNLYNLSEIKAKNVEALRTLLEVAYTEGNSLKESWRDIFTCISQLDRFQLISEGVPEGALPDVLRAEPTSTRAKGSTHRRSLQVPGKRQTSRDTHTNFSADVAEESKSAGIVNGVDRIFTNSGKLTGDAIVWFVRALTQVSWQEIQSSGPNQDPRTYCLQKIVEVSQYNMGRVRFEWTNIWQVLGEHLIKVGCHTNTRVVSFALNALRQLSIRFLDLEELPGFKFQKDFLKPFEHIMSNTSVVIVKEEVLRSLVQLMQLRGDNVKSGWRTIFGVFTVAANEPYEEVVNLAYDNVIQIYNARLGDVMSQGAFADLVVCLTTFSKNSRFQKKSLQAIETLKGSLPKMLKTPECPLSETPSPHPLTKQPSRQTQEEQFWFPVLFAFHDVLMTGDDLEVRSRALNYLFDTLIKYGKQFPRSFWDMIWRQILYPIFMVLKSKSEMSKVVNHEELSVWLSTTMIQALRNMMSLFTHYFEPLEYMLDRFLDLLALCICQENDTLARIGSNCLQTLILSNVNKFSPEHWSKIVSSFVDLFNRTEATALFSAAAASYGAAPTSMNGTPPPPLPSQEANGGNHLQLSDQHKDRRASSGSRQARPKLDPRSASQSNGSAISEEITPTSSQPPTPGLEDYSRGSELSVQQTPVVVTAARRRFFNQIITKCVLQLLMIETVHELFSNDAVYSRIPSAELLRLMGLLKKSYTFAKRFNDDIELRNRLFQEGFMKQPPNLLKQESGSASTYVNILFRMYHDEGAERRSSRDLTEDALIPLCADIIDSYSMLREDTQQRNIVTWRPVVIDVIEGYTNFPADGFAKHAATFAPLLTQVMNRDMGLELQRAVQGCLHRILELHYDMPSLDGLPETPTTAASPNRVNVFGSRRRSRGASVVGMK